MSPEGVAYIRNVCEVDASLLTSGQPSEDQLGAVARSGSVWEPDAVWSRFIEDVLEKHRG
jgi:hypothetical protein